MATTQLRSDPLRNFKFQVFIHHVTAGSKFSSPQDLGTLGFMSVSGLQVTTELIPYREGGMNTTTRKMPGQSDYPPVTFSRGMFAGQMQQWEWFREIFFYQQGVGLARNQPDFRCNILIRVLPHPTAGTNVPYATGGGASPVQQMPGYGVLAYKLYNAWPVSWGNSDLDAGGNGIILEQITVVHEGLVPLPAVQQANGLFAVPWSSEQR